MPKKNLDFPAPLSTNVTTELAEQIRLIAFERRVSKARVIREILQEALKKEPGNG